MKFRVLVAMCIASFSVAAGETPRFMVENVDSLATLKSPLNLCIEGTHYKNLDIKKQVRFMHLAAKVDGMALKIQKFYNDKVIFGAYLQMVSKYSDSQSVNVLMNRYGGLCSDKMYFEIERIFSESEDQMNRYLR